MTYTRAKALLDEQSCKHTMSNPALSVSEFHAIRDAYVNGGTSLGALMHPKP